MALELRVGDATLTLAPAPPEAGADRALVDGAFADVRITPLGHGGRAESALLVVDGRSHVVTIERDGKTTRVWLGGTPIEVEVRTDTDRLLERFGLDTGDAAADREVRAPMPGLVLRLLVEPGQAVEAGQGLVVLEAMKMENELKAPASGTVAAVHAAAGAAVAKNDLLVELDHP